MNPEPNTEGAVDLDLMKKAVALREAAEAERAENERQVAALKWDRAMTRAFKGIMPRSTRLIFMRQVLKREDVD